MKGWFLAGSHPRDYVRGVAPGVLHDGKTVAFLRCTAEKPGGFGTLMQTVAPDEYRGRRLRFSGRLRTTDAPDGGNLWMRVDGPVTGQPLAFDNMREREVRGTAPWTPCEVVLDVGETARAVAFGVTLNGGGAVEFTDLRVEEVGPEVPTTDLNSLPRRPQNLDFSEG